MENYRSLRHLVVPLRRLNVVTGANGSGKSSLYRALRLLADSSRNGAVAALAREGGLPSTLWAGPETIGKAVRRGEHPVQGTARTKPVGLKLGLAGDEYGYAMDLGLPSGSFPGSPFALDPEIKVEASWHGPLLRPAALLAERHGMAVRVREPDGSWFHAHSALRPFDSMLSEISDPQRAPDLMQLRERLRSWRFYDHVRTDAQAPARSPQIGTRTPVLSSDGSDLAAALQTIHEIGDHEALAKAVDRAFPGSSIEIFASETSRFEIGLQQPGMLRPLLGGELSDGTLRYLLWIAALLTPRPPELLVLNEPETSLHPDLLEPLGELISTAADHTQVVVVTHSPQLAKALAEDPDCSIIELYKDLGETKVVDQGSLDEPPWYWPKRLGPPPRPGRPAFECRCDPQEQVFAAVRRDHLQADGQAVAGESGGHADRRMAGQVEHPGEVDGHPVARAFVTVRRARRRRCQQQFHAGEQGLQAPDVMRNGKLGTVRARRLGTVRACGPGIV